MLSPEELHLRELKERLGAAVKLESDLEGLGRFAAPLHENGSPNSGARSGGDAIRVGSHVRVLRGRRFRDFGAGDSGIVAGIEAEGGTVTVAFNGHPEPLQVAGRHLELDPRRSPGARINGNGTRFAGEVTFGAAALGTGEIPSMLPKDSIGLRLDSGNNGAARRAASLPPLHESSPSVAPDRSGDALLSHSVYFRSAHPLSSQGASAPQLQKSLLGALEMAADTCLLQDPLRMEAAELRRAADVAAAAEREAAKRMNVGTSQLRMDISEGMNSIAAAAAGAAREEAEALAEAVQASARATASATASTMSEVNSLRLSMAELQELIANESEQRADSFRHVERDMEQLQAQQMQLSRDEDSLNLKEEQKHLARKQAELVSLCLSLQSRDGAALEKQQMANSDFAEHLAILDQRVALLQSRVNDFNWTEVRGSISELEYRSSVEVESMAAISARLDTMATHLDQKVDREVSPSRQIDMSRIDALASRIDTMVLDISAKAERDTLPYAAHVDALVIHVDKVAENMASEVARLEGLQRRSMEEAIASLEQRESEQLRRLSDEANRHASDLRLVAADIEAKATQAINVGQRAREALEANCSVAGEKTLATIRSRVEALTEGLALEAKLREEAVLRLEEQCLLAREDAVNAAPTAAATAAAGASALESQFRAMLTEARSEASRADSERIAERQTRQAAESAMQRLREEVGELREELLVRQREPPSQDSLPLEEATPPQVTRFVSAPAKETSGWQSMSELIGDVSQFSIAMPREDNGAGRGSWEVVAPPPVVRFSSAPVRELPSLQQLSELKVVQPLQGQKLAHGHLPVAAAFVDSNNDGHPNFLYVGADRNRDGILDALQVPAQPEVLRRAGSPIRSGSVIEPSLAQWAAASPPRQAGPQQITPGFATPPVTARPLKNPITVPVQQVQTVSTLAPKCNACGSTYMPDANFCRRCGKKRTDLQGLAAQGSLTPPQPPPRPLASLQAAKPQGSLTPPQPPSRQLSSPFTFGQGNFTPPHPSQGSNTTLPQRLSSNPSMGPSFGAPGAGFGARTLSVQSKAWNVYGGGGGGESISMESHLAPRAASLGMD